MISKIQKKVKLASSNLKSPPPKTIDELAKKDELLKRAIEAAEDSHLDNIKTFLIDATMQDYLPLYFFADLHLGATTSELRYHLATLKELVKIVGIKIAALGDIFDNNTESSPGSPHENILNPLEQTKVGIKLYSVQEVYDSIVALLGGNHDGLQGNRNKDAMTSLVMQVANAIGQYGKSGEYAVRLKFIMRNPKMPEGFSYYTVIIDHGSGKGGAGIGSALDYSKSKLNVYGMDVDMIVHGHFHQNEEGVLVVPYIDPKTGKEYLKEVKVVALGALVGSANYAYNAIPSNTQQFMHVITIGESLYGAPYAYRNESIAIGSQTFYQFAEKSITKNEIKLKEKDLKKIEKEADQFVKRCSKYFYGGKELQA